MYVSSQKIMCIGQSFHTGKYNGKGLDNFAIIDALELGWHNASFVWEIMNGTVMNS